MNIQLSQILLVIALLIFGLYVFRVRTVLTDRIVLLILAAVILISASIFVLGAALLFT